MSQILEKKNLFHYWTSKANTMQLRAPLKRGEVCGGGRDRNKHENEDIEILFNFKQYLSALLTGDVRIVKFIRACLSSRLTLGFNCSALFRPHTIPTFWSNRGLFSWGCTCGLFWPHTTLAHLTSQAKSSEENCRSSLVYQRDNFLPIWWGCLGENVEDQWGKCWSSRHHPENHLWRGTVCCGTAWYGIVWSSQKIIFDVV